MKLVFFLAVAALALFVAAINCDLFTAVNPKYEPSVNRLLDDLCRCPLGERWGTAICMAHVPGFSTPSDENEDVSQRYTYLRVGLAPEHRSGVQSCSGRVGGARPANSAP